MSKVLITGANGFVGHYLTQQLLQKGHTITATGKGSNRLPFTDENFTYQSLDFIDALAVTETIQSAKPDVVVHCGALSKPDECELNKEAAFKTNLTGTINLLNASSSIGANFIFLSTDFVFSGEEGFYNEEDERKPVNYYGETKVLAEDEVMKYDGVWTIVRTILVYGKPLLSRHNLLTNVAAGLKEGKTLKIFSDQMRTPTYVEDLASALVSIIERKAQGIYHICGKDKLSPYEMAVATARHLGLEEKNIEPVVEKDFDQPARRPPRTAFDLSKARRDLRYEPFSFAEGLRKTFE